MGGAVAETLTVNPCGQCGYDMGHNYIECTTTGECPECGHTFKPEVCEDPYLDDEYGEPEEVCIEQIATTDMIYCPIHLPQPYRWDDVASWNVRRDILNITWHDGTEWSAELEHQHNETDATGDYRAYNTLRDLLGEY